VCERAEDFGGAAVAKEPDVETLDTIHGSSAVSPRPSARRRAQIKMLIGAGDRIAAGTVPFALGGIAANVLWPLPFQLGLGTTGLVLGGVLLAVGIPLWFTSAVQILLLVPQRKLITRGPFALMIHPLYTSVALLVVPGVGLLFDSWLGFALGLVLYVESRRFAPSEEREVAQRFPEEYAAYRKRVLLPWL
jgi:protein-S-isoprenylcysteine O-methyltransferase Ste14